MVDKIEQADLYKFILAKRGGVMLEKEVWLTGRAIHGMKD